VVEHVDLVVGVLSVVDDEWEVAEGCVIRVGMDGEQKWGSKYMEEAALVIIFG
jgi:hypothetical protein